MTISRTASGLLAGLICLSGATAVLAGEPITVLTDHSKVLEMPRTPGTIIVGNPSIADVTVQDNKVFLHARGYGSTNILVLDDQGNNLADYDVTVQTGGDNNVYVFKAGLSQAYVCSPDCEATLHIGDNVGFFNDTSKMQTKRVGIALGQKDGEAVAGPQDQQPPQ